MAELHLESITKTFGELRAVDDVSLEVADQEFMVLLGPSGCGKSTLLRSVAGLEEIDGGRIVIGGDDVTSKKPKDRNISMVFQSYAVFPHLTVYENIAFGLRRQKKQDDEVKRRVGTTAELLHIEDLLDRHPANLSGGQRQRVAVARALAVDSDVLLMDEPLSNLDALLRIEMRAELKRLLAELETTTIYVTHDQVEALSMGDRIAVMEDGVLQQIAGPIEVYNRPSTRFVGGFIGNPPMNFIDATVDGDSVVVGTAKVAVPAPKQSGWMLLGIRAENVDVEEAATPGALPSRVVVNEPLGSHNLVTLEVAGQTVKVTTHADRSLLPDQDVWLRLAPEKVVWIDPETSATVAIGSQAT